MLLKLFKNCRLIVDYKIKSIKKNDTSYTDLYQFRSNREGTDSRYYISNSELPLS